MSNQTISRRTIAKGAAWAVPAVSLAGTVPAFATSPSCPTFESSGCWACGFQDGYTAISTSTGSNSQSLNTSNRLIAPAGGVAAGTTICVEFFLTVPKGATVTMTGFNGCWGASSWGNWSGPTQISKVTGNVTNSVTGTVQSSDTYTYNICVTAGSGGITGGEKMCGGFQVDITGLTSAQWGSYGFTGTSLTPSGGTTISCPASVGQSFTNGAGNATTYGAATPAAQSCSGGYTWPKASAGTGAGGNCPG